MPPDHDRSIVIVGAGAAGTGTALALRRNGHRGAITLLGEELELPYDRPPLSKGVLLGPGYLVDIALTTADELRAQRITFRPGERATGLDPTGRAVHLDRGSSIAYDVLVLATGAGSRTLPGMSGMRNVHALRTVGDATRLRSDLRSGRRLGVIGGGLIGLEVAASARKLGLDVTVIEPAPLPLADRLTQTVARWLVSQHTRHGVDLRLGTGVGDYRIEDDTVTSLVLTDGCEVPVDAVLVCVGASPHTQWLVDSGLPLDNGVVCDEYQRVAENVYAVGDLAYGFHPVYGRRLRMETRSNASEGAAHLARSLMSGPAPYLPVPFFWTDQYDFKVQAFGAVDPLDDVEFVHGSVEEDRWILVGRRDGRLRSVIARDSGKRLLQWRRLLHGEFVASDHPHAIHTVG